MSSPAAVGSQVEDGYLPGSSEYRRIMLAMFAAGMATFVLLYDTQALLPAFAREFQVSPTEASLTLSLASIGLAFALLVAGPLSERYGRTVLVKGSVWASAVVAVATALAPTWPSLLGLRLLQGVVLAGLPAVATAYLREELHASALGRAAGLYIGGTALGGMTGRLLTGPLAEQFGWRWGMAAAACFALLTAAVVSLLLPASRHFVRSSGRHAVTWPQTKVSLTDPVLLGLYLVGGCGLGALVATFNALGFRLTSPAFGLGLGAVGLLYLVYPLGSLASAVAGRAADTYGQRAVMPVGAAIGLLGVALTVSDWLPAVVAGLACITIGFFTMHGLASGWVALRAHLAGGSTSQAAANYLFVYYVGASVLGTLATTVWTAAGWGGVATLVGVLLGTCGVTALALRRTRALT